MTIRIPLLAALAVLGAAVEAVLGVQRLMTYTGADGAYSLDLPDGE